MTINVGTLATSFRGVLLDPSPGVTWTDQLLLVWLNDVLAAAADLKRDINPQIVTIPLAPGSIQSLPAGNLQLLEPYQNVDGAGITLADRELVTRRLSAWAGSQQTLDVTDVMLDERSPLIFHVYPPNNGNGQIQALCGVVPAIPTAAFVYPLITSAVAVPVPDNYQNALVDGVVSKALGANTRRQDIQKATFYWQRFEAQIVGAKLAQREAAAPLAVEETK